MVEVLFIGGVDESYMITSDAQLEKVAVPLTDEVIFLSLEEVGEMMSQFKKLLKKEQWQEIVQ